MPSVETTLIRQTRQLRFLKSTITFYLFQVIVKFKYPRRAGNDVVGNTGWLDTLPTSCQRHAPLTDRFILVPSGYQVVERVEWLDVAVYYTACATVGECPN